MRLAAMVVFAVCLPVGALAQSASPTPTVSLALGASVGHFDVGVNGHDTVGMHGALDVPISDGASIILDADRHAWSYPYVSSSGSYSVNQALYGFGVGLRIASGHRESARFFGQTVLGIRRLNQSIERLSDGSATSDPGQTSLMLQPGIGVELPFASHAVLQVQGDWRLSWQDGTRNDWRASANIAFLLGR